MSDNGELLECAPLSLPDASSERDERFGKAVMSIIESITTGNCRMHDALTQIVFLAGETWIDADKRLERIVEIARVGLERERPEGHGRLGTPTSGTPGSGGG